MVLIFGWGRGQADDRGEVAPVRCPNCHNDVVLHEIHSTKQVSLFFVPVMPYGTDDYLVCPICSHGMQVRPEHRSAVEGMRWASSAFRSGTIAAPEYRARADAFWQSMEVAGGGAPPAARSTVAGGPGQSAPAAEATLADRLAGLGRLHADGVLTDDEFSAAKRRLLG